MSNALRLLFIACALAAGGACPNERDDPRPIGDDDDDDDDVEAIVPQLSLDRVELSFGSILLSSTASSTVIVSNNGDVGSQTGPLTISATGDFAIVTACGDSLGAGEACEINVRFAPASVGPHEGTLTVQSPDEVVSASLTGFAFPANAATISPSTADFGSIEQGATSLAQTFTVTNETSEESGPLVVTLGGADPSHFVVVTDDCSAATLPGGASCALAVAFAPLSDGSKVATLTIDGRATDAVSASLSGEGLPDGGVFLTISPTSRNFGSVEVGLSSPELLFTVTNAGGLGSPPLQPNIATEDAASFAVTSSTCNVDSLAAGDSCTVGVTFTPADIGVLEANLDVGTVTASLSGTGTP